MTVLCKDLCLKLLDCSVKIKLCKCKNSFFGRHFGDIMTKSNLYNKQKLKVWKFNKF